MKKHILFSYIYVFAQGILDIMSLCAYVVCCVRLVVIAFAFHGEGRYICLLLSVSAEIG